MYISLEIARVGCGERDSSTIAVDAVCFLTTKRCFFLLIFRRLLALFLSIFMQLFAGYFIILAGS